MTATDAMSTILDINEISEKIKNNNVADVPNLDWCKVTTLLENYRELLLDVMDITEIRVKK